MLLETEHRGGYANSNEADNVYESTPVANETNNNNQNNNNNNNEMRNNVNDNGMTIERGTTIQNFYAGQSVFITGGTGFLGKILIEKLLRSCPDISTIYLLIRAKKDKNVEDRLEDLFNDPIYDRLREESPKFRHKVVAMSGDCSVRGLGLSSADRERLVQEVSIVFHSAATVRFDEKLDIAMDINVGSTLDMIVLCKRMERLRAFIHVSTAYANCTVPKIAESFYPHSTKYEDLKALISNLDDQEIAEITPNILGRWPNTYTFTKALAEVVVNEKNQGLIMGIFRPAIAMYLVTGTISIIVQILLAIGIFLLTLLGKIILFICAMIYTVVRPRRLRIEGLNINEPFETMYPEYDFEDDLETMTRVSLETLTSQDNVTPDQTLLKEYYEARKSDRLLVMKQRQKLVISTAYEPLPGWIDNFYGPTGAVAAVASGILKTMHCNPEISANIVPVDFTVNALIASAWDVANQPERRNENMLIYNYVSNIDAPLSWQKFSDFNLTYANEYPLSQIKWSMSLYLQKYKTMDFISRIFLHYIPAILVDLFCICLGQKPMLMKMYRKIHKFINVVSWFSNREWVFTNDNVQSMWNRLDTKDKQNFRFNIKELNWRKYCKNYMKGVRKYLLKDDINTLEESRNKLKRFRMIHETLKTLLFTIFLWLMWKIVASIFF